MKRILVLGAGGFIGTHLVLRLKEEDAWVRGVDIKVPEFSTSAADDFVLGDLRDQVFCRSLFDHAPDEIYQLAADMGGAGFIFTGEHDADIMHNSATVNLNILDCASEADVPRIFYSSSACIYPERNQEDPDNPDCREHTAYPADPDSEYGWEKLFSERLYQTYAKNRGIEARIARYHNIFGPLGTYDGGREKAPAAICRKVAEAENGGSIEIWGDGTQTRSFLYVDECIEGTLRLMRSDCTVPLNIGSEEMVTINNLAKRVISISGKDLRISNIDGPTGVRGRNSNNDLIMQELGWAPNQTLDAGLRDTYAWVSRMVSHSNA